MLKTFSQLLLTLMNYYNKADTLEKMELKRELETFLENIQASFKCAN